MSKIDTQGQTQFSDDDFDSFVNSNQADIDSNKASTARQFTDILYTDIPKPSSSDPDACRIVRFRGGPPNSDRTAYTARTVISNRIRDDQNKMMTLRLPDDRNHLYWRFINAVLETEGRGKDAVFVNKEKMPEAFNRVRYGSAAPTANQFKYDKGWKGREYLVANVIDRSAMDVHRSEKHTMLLCKDARPSKKDPSIVFYDEGVPAYGFVQPLVQSLFKPYKNWENYDVGIFRTGEKTMPYRLINASLYLKEVPEHLRALVGPEGPLTDEELSWEMYDLRRFLATTPYERMLERNGQLFIEVDNYLGSKFFEELQDLANDEKLAREANAPAEEEASVQQTAQPDLREEVAQVPTRQTPPAQEIPSRQPIASEGDPLTDVKAKLTAEGFSDLELSQIVSYQPSNASSPFGYTAPITEQARCPECGVPSPLTFHRCPNPDCLYTFPS